MRRSGLWLLLSCAVLSLALPAMAVVMKVTIAPNIATVLHAQVQALTAAVKVTLGTDPSVVWTVTTVTAGAPAASFDSTAASDAVFHAALATADAVHQVAATSVAEPTQLATPPGSVLS